VKATQVDRLKATYGAPEASAITAGGGFGLAHGAGGVSCAGPCERDKEGIRMPKKLAHWSLACVLLLGLAAAAALLVGAGCASGSAQVATSPAQSAAGAGDAGAALLVVRRAGAKDDLVRLAGGTAQTVGTLPGRAAGAVAAPDESRSAAARASRPVRALSGRSDH